MKADSVPRARSAIPGGRIADAVSGAGASNLSDAWLLKG
jgi:hypothetical protein